MTLFDMLMNGATAERQIRSRGLGPRASQHLLAQSCLHTTRERTPGWIQKLTVSERPKSNASSWSSSKQCLHQYPPPFPTNLVEQPEYYDRIKKKNLSSVSFTEARGQRFQVLLQPAPCLMDCFFRRNSPIVFLQRPAAGPANQLLNCNRYVPFLRFGHVSLRNPVSVLI